MYEFDLSVAGISLRLKSDYPVSVDESFRPFMTGCSAPDVHAVFRCVDELPRMPEKLLYKGGSVRIFEDETGNRMRFYYAGACDETPYAVAAEDADGNIQVQYLARETPRVSRLYHCFQHLALESLLIQRNRMFLHAACVRTSLGGLLFSGPSGIGKSTQAELWGRYRDTKQINGDRPILEKGEDSWHAWGAPYAGSSNCYVNENCPVSAIVMLRQEKDCTLRRMTEPEAFRALWSGATVQSWDRAFAERASDLILELIKTVPVFEFGCTPDERAVEFLEQALGKELG